MASSVARIETYQRMDDIIAIFRSEVREAKAKNSRLGVANVFWENGQRYFELPNGEITTTPPDGWDVKS